MAAFRYVAILFLLLFSVIAQAEWRQGIYISQNTVENTPYFKTLLENASEVGINTVVIDLERLTNLYKENIAWVKKYNFKHIVRIVMFPGGGVDAQIKSQAYWQKKYALIEQALAMGAQEVQLDYIRYRPTQTPSAQNAKNIYKVIHWFKQKLAARNIPLEIDVFGISSFGPSKYIGQDVRLFSDTIDALCPMLYPSHFEPYRQHALTPYQTLFKSLTAIKKQFDGGKPPFKIYTYIELFNYRYRYADSNRLGYIQAQIDAVRDTKGQGWYAWSANNTYDKLFQLLKMHPPKPQFNPNVELKRRGIANV